MSRPLPTPRQLDFQDWEFGVFLHFGIRTFYEGHRDWDGKPMAADHFLPADLNCDQWAAVTAAAGAKYMVLTAKHHDGFANWPSKHTDFSVVSSPWKGGQGDVIREYTDACRRHGLGVGIYYSPADSVANSRKGQRDYDEYFISQVGELLTGYGQIDMLWFDGCGSEGHTYDWPRIMREIRRMQPGIRIFNMGGDPDYRWVGNEAGLAPSPCYNAVKALDFSIQTSEREELAGGRRWLPAECDCRMREHNWFYSDADIHTVKSLEELMGLYYYSVGRGANLLLNIGPDRRGHLPGPDVARLLEFGAEIRRRFGAPLAQLSEFKREGEVWTYTSERAFLVDHLSVQEEIAAGEAVEAFAVKVLPYPHGKPLTVYEGRTIGHKAICRFPAVRTKQVLLEIVRAEGPVSLRALTLHNTSGISI